MLDPQVGRSAGGLSGAVGVHRTSTAGAAEPTTVEGRWVPLICGLAIASVFSGIEWNVGQAVVRPFDLLIGWALLVLVARAVLIGRLPLQPLGVGGAILAAYLVYRSLNAMRASPFDVAVVETIQGAELLVLFVLVATIAQTRSGLRRAMVGMCLGLGVVCLWAFGYHVARGEYFSFKRLDEPKLAFGMLLVVMVSWRLDDLRSARWACWGPAISAVTLLVLLSGERKMWVAASVAVAVVSLRNARILRRPAAICVLALFAIVLAVGPIVLASAPEGNRTLRQFRSFGDLPAVLADSSSQSDFTSRSNESRTALIRLGVETFRANPIVGIGPDGFAQMVRAQQDRDFLGKSPHNEFLLVAAENGLPGLGLFTGLALMTLMTGWRGSRLARREPRPGAVVGLGLGVLGVALNLFLAGGLLNMLVLVVPAAIAAGAPGAWSRRTPQGVPLQSRFRTSPDGRSR